MAILDETSLTGAAGVVWGLPGDWHNRVKRVDLSKDLYPNVFLISRPWGTCENGAARLQPSLRP